jgi:hypothetical protein
MLASFTSFFGSKKIVNNPLKKGELAAPKKLFGDDSRYAIAPIHTRFDEVSWFVWDAELLNQHGKAEVIRQSETMEEALNGLL